MLATQASEVSEKPRSSRIEGRATPTMVTSRTIIRSPRQTIISASHRFLWIIESASSVVCLRRDVDAGPPISTRRRKIFADGYDGDVENAAAAPTSARPDP